MAGMLAIGALRSYVPDYLKMEISTGSHTFNFTVAVENEEGEMPSGATAVAGAGLIGAMAIPYLLDSAGGLEDILGTEAQDDPVVNFDSAPGLIGSSSTAGGKGNPTK
jgi:threonine dehydrogenase-like Zn-dependent dehydrogenase